MGPNISTLERPATGSQAASVQYATDADWADWDAYVASAPCSTVCHLSGWKKAVEATWGHRHCYLLARRAGLITGLLPLFHVKTLFGSMLVSVPNGVYGGVLADDDDSATALLARARDIATERRVQYVELRNWRPNQCPPTETGFVTKDLYVHFDHPLSANEETTFATFPRDTRRMIRLGTKNGLVPELGRENLLADFYEVYAHSMHNLGTPVFPKSLFRNLLREFSERSDILVMRQNGRVASAVLTFYFRGIVAPYYVGAYREFFNTGVNYTMYWELMKHAALLGCTCFDFGRSKKGTGAYAFKKNWKMTEHPLPYAYYLIRGRRVPDLSPNNSSFSAAIVAWRRLPFFVTKLLGPAVVRHLP